MSWSRVTERYRLVSMEKSLMRGHSCYTRKHVERIPTGTCRNYGCEGSWQQWRTRSVGASASVATAVHVSRHHFHRPEREYKL
jgi:hypothetical protein